MHSWSNKVVFCLVLFGLYGCTPKVTIPLPTIAPTFTPIEKNTQTPTSMYRNLWKELREPVDGWGIAIPANWSTYINYNPENKFSYLQIMNFDLAFFESTSGEKAWRTWGYVKSIKVEIVKRSGFVKFDSLKIGILDWIENTEYVELVKIEEITINKEKSIKYIEKWAADGQLYLHYAFKLNLNEILIWSCYPNSSWERADIQGILSSIAIKRNADVYFPDIKPGDIISYNP